MKVETDMIKTFEDGVNIQYSIWYNDTFIT